MKKITIITINYNDAEGLQKTIESIVNQNSSNFDFIILKNNSNN
jgi:glycosyltransferase involved in cell wall biosynthesis